MLPQVRSLNIKGANILVSDCVCVCVPARVGVWVCVLLLNICALSSGGKQLPLPISAHLWMRGARAEHNVSCLSRKGGRGE